VDAPAVHPQIVARPTPPKPDSVPQAESSVLSGATRQGSAVEAPPSAAEAPAINAGDIIKSWKHLAASLPKAQANLGALMNSVKMIDVQGKTLVLGLASDVLVEKLNKPDQLEIIQKLIKDHFRVDLSVRCAVSNAKGKIPANVAQDGMVAAAIQHGGEVVDMD